MAALGKTASTPFFEKFYDSCITDPRKPLGALRYVALDFETTGLDPTRDSIVSIGLVPFDLQRIYCREARYWLVKPDRPLAERSVLVHGITHAQLEAAADLETLLERILQTLSGSMVIVHFHHIERQFLLAGARRCYNEALQFPLIDTMLIEEAVQKTRGKTTLLRLFNR